MPTTHWTQTKHIYQPAASLSPQARQNLQGAGLTHAGIKALEAGAPITDKNDSKIVAEIVKQAVG